MEVGTFHMEQNIFVSESKPLERIILREYQVKALDEIKKGWLGNRLGNTFNSQLLVLSTGLGKTICFAALADWVIKQHDGRVLVLAHREELLEQAEEKIRRVIGGEVAIGREQAGNRASVQFDKIVTASVATLGRSITEPGAGVFVDGVMQSVTKPNDRLARFPRDHFKLIIIDEAHHSTADTYKNILNYFAGPDSNTWVLGVTATPKRTDKESLREVYKRVAFKMDIVDGTKLGFLAPVVSHRVSSRTDLDGVKTTAGDFNIKALAERVNNQERNSLIVSTYLERFKGQQCIVFATDLDHARAIDSEFDRLGVVSAAISGDMGKDERREAIKAFKEGRVEVLTNFGVLTEGFDHERLSVIINARPTKSRLLLTQIVGRGTRLHPQKEKCDFVEIVDNHSEETATCAEIFGFKQKFDCEAVSFVDCIRMAEAMEIEKEYFNAWILDSVSEMQRRFSLATPDDPSGSGKPNWDGDRDDRVADRFDSRYRYYSTSGGSFKLNYTDRGTREMPINPPNKYLVRIEPDGMGGYTSTLSIVKKGEPAQKLYLFECYTVLEAAHKVEDCIQENYSDWDILLNLKAGWRKKAAGEPCTDKQWSMIQKFKLSRGRSKHEITKADAMEIISKFFNK